MSQEDVFLIEADNEKEHDSSRYEVEQQIPQKVGNPEGTCIEIEIKTIKFCGSNQFALIHIFIQLNTGDYASNVTKNCS